MSQDLQGMHFLIQIHSLQFFIQKMQTILGLIRFAKNKMQV